jgi:osmotically-inducible protein OsmY
VTLGGEVGSEPQREEALRVAMAVPGVRSVRSTIEMRPGLLQAGGPSLSDQARDRRLEAEGRLAFSLHRELADSGLELHAERGHVSVAGKVESAEQRRLALEVASALPHAQGVKDETYFGCPQPPVAEPSLEARAQEAQRALAGSAHLAGYGLSVRIQDGRLLLEGLVASGIEKDLAEALAERAAGQDVEDALQVRS